MEIFLFFIILDIKALERHLPCYLLFTITNTKILLWLKQLTSVQCKCCFIKESKLWQWILIVNNWKLQFTISLWYWMNIPKRNMKRKKIVWILVPLLYTIFLSDFTWNTKKWDANWVLRIEMRTEFWLNLWIECSDNIYQIKVLFTCWGNTYLKTPFEIIPIMIMHHIMLPVDML